MLLQKFDHDTRLVVADVRAGPVGLRRLLSWRGFADAVRTLVGAWRGNRGLVGLTIALAAAQLALVALFYLHHMADAGDWNSATLLDFRLGFLLPGSYPKAFTYGEAGAAVILSAAAFARLRQPVYLAAAVAMFAVLLDMTFGVHSRAAWVIVRVLDLAALGGIGPVVRLGEAVGMASGGVGVAAVLVIAAAWSRPGHAQAGLVLLAALGGLGVFAAGFEVFLSLAVQAGSPAYLPIKLAEEIGEMVMLGAISVLAAVLAVHGDRLGSSRVSGPA